MFSDPPYYDAIPYSDLSDFFFVWLKRALPDHALLRDPFDGNNRLTPKTQEAVQDEDKTSRWWAERPILLEQITHDDVAFDPGVFLLRKERAKVLISSPGPEPGPGPQPVPPPAPGPEPAPVPPGPVELQSVSAPAVKTVRIVGTIPPELWNRLGTKIIPKMKSGSNLSVGIDFSIDIDGTIAKGMEADLRQILEDLGLKDRVMIKSDGE